MTYDPFQIHSALGAYPGFTNPLQYGYPSLNPLTGLNPLTAAYSQIPGAGINPQQLQLAQILAARAAVPQLAGSPWASALTNPLLSAATLQNPFLGNVLENPILAHSQLGMQPGLHPYLSAISPYSGQFGSPFGGLAPQSWIGQQGLFGQQGFGQQGFGHQGLYGAPGVHPLLSQLSGRGIHGAGMFPTAF